MKADGVLIANIRQEMYADKKIKWVWRTIAVEVRHNKSGACDSLEEAAEAVKNSGLDLIGRRRPID